MKVNYIKNINPKVTNLSNKKISSKLEIAIVRAIE